MTQQDTPAPDAGHPQAGAGGGAPDAPPAAPASPANPAGTGTPGAGGTSGGGKYERRSHAVGWQSRDVMRTAGLVIGLYLVAQLLWFANALVLVAFLGVLFGLAVEAGVDRLERFRIPRGVGAAIIVLGFFGLLTGFGAAMAPTVRQQSRELREKIPQAVDRIEEWVNDRRRGMFGFLIPGSEVGDTATASGVTGATAGAPAPGAGATTRVAVRGDTLEVRIADADTVAPASTTPDDTAESLRESVGRQMRGAARYLFPFLSQTLAVVAGILLIIFMSIYIAAEPDLYHSGLMHLFPHHTRARAGEVLSAVAAVLRRWLVTQLIAMVAIGTVTTIVLLILDVEAAFALGLIAGLLEFIPTIGPIISAVPAVAMGFLDSPEKALIVTAAYVGIQFLENHLLIPMLMKGGVGVPPVLTILGQALFTLLFGFLGLLVAVPLLAAVMVVVKMLYVEGVVGDDVDVVHVHESG